MMDSNTSTHLSVLRVLVNMDALVKHTLNLSQIVSCPSFFYSDGTSLSTDGAADPTGQTSPTYRCGGACPLTLAEHTCSRSFCVVESNMLLLLPSLMLALST